MLDILIRKGLVCTLYVLWGEGAVRKNRYFSISACFVEEGVVLGSTASHLLREF